MHIAPHSMPPPLLFDGTDDPQVFHTKHDALFNCQPMTREDVQVCALCGEPANGKLARTTFRFNGLFWHLPVHETCLTRAMQ